MPSKIGASLKTWSRLSVVFLCVMFAAEKGFYPLTVTHGGVDVEALIMIGSPQKVS